MSWCNWCDKKWCAASAENRTTFKKIIINISHIGDEVERTRLITEAIVENWMHNCSKCIEWAIRREDRLNKK